MASDSLTVAGDERFGFGSNWRRFLDVLDEARIVEAQRALGEMLGSDSLEGRSFLDIGSGSGLSSLAAMRMGAERVHSFDYDPESVACTAELRRRYYPADGRWTVERGDALDRAYTDRLGQFDVVYSWGVLHHTGSMWRALEGASGAVAPEGRLFVAIYNHQGWRTTVWTRIKELYNRAHRALRTPLVLAIVLPIELKAFVGALVRGRLVPYLRSWSDTGRRGMSRWHDHVDWVGGLPFEAAVPEEIFEFYERRGFRLTRLRTCGGDHGCNEFVFVRSTDS